MPSNIIAYEWLLNGTAHIVYETVDNHIHEMAVGQKGTWRDNDIMRATGSPELESAILTGFPWPAGITQQIAYTSPWTFTDLTALAGAPLAAGSALAASAWETGRTKYVAYVGSNNHIYELQMPLQGSWEHTDLTQLLGLPEASEDVLATHEWLPEFAKP